MFVSAGRGRGCRDVFYTQQQHGQRRHATALQEERPSDTAIRVKLGVIAMTLKLIINKHSTQCCHVSNLLPFW